MLTSPTRAVVDACRASSPPPLDDLEELAADRDFPIVGPDVGRLLRTLTTSLEPRRVFEFGSGFGYSAAWIAGGCPRDAELVLTDYDEEDLERARGAVERTGFDGQVRTVAGDAVATMYESTESFDLVLVDNEKERYPAALDALTDRVNPRGLVVADNALAGPVTPEAVRDALVDGDRPSTDAAGVARYLQRVTTGDEYETSIVPLGEGIAISRRV